MKSGCVQGSILGPTIPLTLLDTVHYHLNFLDCSKYADGYKFYARNKTNEDHKMMQKDIENTVKWADDCSVLLNSD